MPKKGQLLLPLILGGAGDATKLTFTSTVEEAASTSSTVNRLNPLTRLARSVDQIEEMQETTPEFCIHPAAWYRDMAPNVGFTCSTKTGVHRHNDSCTVTCSNPDSVPNMEEVKCSCYRLNGKQRQRCKWLPQRKYATPTCSRPILGQGAMKNVRNLRIGEAVVPDSHFDDIHLFTPKQAEMLTNLGILESKPNVKRPENSEDYMKQLIQQSKASGLTRSHFKAVDKWTMFQDNKGVYTVPYRFSKEFNEIYNNDIRDLIRGHLDFMNSELGQCIQFEERDDFVLNGGRLNIVAAGKGCWSYIGRVNYEQKIRKHAN